MTRKRDRRLSIRFILLLVGIFPLLSSCGTSEVSIERTPTPIATTPAPVADLTTRPATPAPTPVSPTAMPAWPTATPSPTPTATPSPTPTARPTATPGPTLCAQARISGNVCAAGVTVTVSSCCPEWSAQTTSDAQGHFEFAGFTPGTFEVSAQGRSLTVTLAECDSTATVDLCPAFAGELRSPMVVDSEAGRLYMPATIEGSERIVALAADDGRLLTTYDVTGPFDVDGVHGWLYVDRDETGLIVLDAATGGTHNTILLPSNKDEWQEDNPAPQADPATGQVLAFRDNVVYIIDPDQGTVIDTISFDIPKEDDCRDLTEPLPISWSEYDSSRRLLYLSFLTFVCTPWYAHTIVSYDLNNDAEVARQGYSGPFVATAANGYLYGANRRRYEGVFRWVWQDGQPRLFVFDPSGSYANLYVDAARGRVYESTGILRVFDAETMVLLFSVPCPVEGGLTGYDPKTDQLYFLDEGQLRMWPAGAIEPPPEMVLDDIPSPQPASLLSTDLKRNRGDCSSYR